MNILNFGKSNNKDTLYIESVIKFCLTLLRGKDITTYNHTLNVEHLSQRIIAKMGVNGNIAKGVKMGSILHDIGKISIPSSILLKAEPLTKIERHVMDNHPKYGYDLVNHFSPFIENEILDSILNHHEKNGGLGYPGSVYKLNIITEIIAISDIAAAMQEPRVYRSGLLLDDAIEELMKYEWNKDIVSIINKEPDILLLNKDSISNGRNNGISTIPIAAAT
jgi:putative nucleotidyltransferase with HDIG domain